MKDGNRYREKDCTYYEESNSILGTATGTGDNSNF